MSFNRFLEKTITKSQRCQRNWDLSKNIPVEDIKTMKTSVTQCSSKQNRVFYKCKFITNRDVIEKVYENTIGANWTSKNPDDWHSLDTLGFSSHQEAIEGGYHKHSSYDVYAKVNADTNPQTLANLLVAFIRDRDPSEGIRTHEERMSGKSKGGSENEHQLVKRDEATALGIGAGYLTLTANMLGYSSGCCQCGDFEKVSEVLGEKEETLLLMGIGYPQEGRSRLEHHVTGRRFTSHNKNVIIEDVI